MHLPLISLQGITKEYQMGEVIVKALQNLTLDIEPGRFVVILGPSGSGKTSLLNLISSIDVPTAGKIFIDNVDITFLNRKQRAIFRRKKVGFIFQFFNLLPTLTALENVEFSLDLIGIPQAFGEPSYDKILIKDVAMNWLDKVGLRDRADHFPSQLSGGEQQRVAIARALAKNPPIIVADEPTGNLDYQTGISVLKLMKQLNKETSKTFIIATHNRQISRIADLILTIQMGKITQFEQKEPIDVENLVW